MLRTEDFRVIEALARQGVYQRDIAQELGGAPEDGLKGPEARRGPGGRKTPARFTSGYEVISGVQARGEDAEGDMRRMPAFR
jgi:hypothetical protein